MDKIIFSEKLPAQSKNTSLTACRHTAAFLKCILLISHSGNRLLNGCSASCKSRDPSFPL